MIADRQDLLDQNEIRDIDVKTSKLVAEFILGNHLSRHIDDGIDFSDLRQWQRGDRASTIDWGHSSYFNFNPLMVREVVSERTLPIIMVADDSPSVWCGTHGMPIAKIIIRALAVIGFSASVIQDPVGLICMDNSGATMPRRMNSGKNHIFQLIHEYQQAAHRRRMEKRLSLDTTVFSALRRPGMAFIISDFLFPLDEDEQRIISMCASLSALHDVVLAIVRSDFAFKLPAPGAGWLSVQDAETGRTRLVSAGEIQAMSQTVYARQNRFLSKARDAGLPVIMLEPEAETFYDTLISFFMQRRIRNGK